MIVEVFLSVCLNVAAHIGCDRIEITDNTSAAEDYPVTMTACLGLEGLNTAKEYYAKHREQLGAMEFQGWACKIGNKKLPARGGA